MGSAWAIASSITASSAARSSGREDTSCFDMPLVLLSIVILARPEGAGSAKSSPTGLRRLLCGSAGRAPTNVCKEVGHERAWAQYAQFSLYLIDTDIVRAS